MFTSQAQPPGMVYKTQNPSQNESPPVVPGLTYESYTLMRYPQMPMPMMNGYASDPSSVPKFSASDSASPPGYGHPPRPMNDGMPQHMSPYHMPAGYPPMKSHHPTAPQTQNYTYMSAAPVQEIRSQYPAVGSVKAEYAQHPYLFQGARCEAAELHQPPSTQENARSGNLAVPTKKHFCCYCGKGFIRPSALQTHIYSHTGEKPFTCKEPNCNKSFSVVSNLRRHMKIHEKS